MQAKKAEEIAKQYEKSNFDVKIYEGLGHITETPFAPPTQICFHPLFPKPIQLEFGGKDPILHGMAQEQIWKDTLTFLRNHFK